MTPTSFDTALLALLAAKPFRRFVITLNDGRSFEVDRSNAVATKAGVAVFLATGPGIHPFDHTNTASFTPTTPEG